MVILNKNPNAGDQVVSLRFSGVNRQSVELRTLGIYQVVKTKMTAMVHVKV